MNLTQIDGAAFLLEGVRLLRDRHDNGWWQPIIWDPNFEAGACYRHLVEWMTDRLHDPHGTGIDAMRDTIEVDLDDNGDGGWESRLRRPKIVEGWWRAYGITGGGVKWIVSGRWKSITITDERGE